MCNQLRFTAVLLAGLFSAAAMTFAATPIPAKSGVKSVVADAAEKRDWQRLASLVKAGHKVETKQADGMTALHWAAYHGKTDMVDRLLVAGSNARAVTRYDVTPLSIACELGRSEITRRLLEAGADANQKLPGGERPLMLAARVNDADSIRHLVKHGAKIDETERNGQTALMWAAAHGNFASVEALLEAGADINVANKTDFTAMMFAAREGQIDVVQQLLRAGVDVNAVMQPKKSGRRVPRKGTSALTLAVESGHFELAMLLIEAGADPNDQRSGYSPLHALTWVRKPDRGEDPNGDPPPRGSGKLSSLQFVDAIVAAGADVNLQLENGKGGKAVLNRKGATPFLMAAKTADVPYLSLLVEHGANPKTANVDGATPLMAAAGIGVRAVGEEAGTEEEVIETLKFLLAHGLDVNAEDKNRETAMHGAAYRCFPAVIEFLSKHGADPAVWNHKNKYGWTPVMIGQGHRPGSFKPDPDTVAALRAAMK